MRLVLDANECIYAFGAFRKPACEALVFALGDRDGDIVRVVRTMRRKAPLALVALAAGLATPMPK